MRRPLAIGLALLLPITAWGGVQNGHFTATWDVPEMPAVYEFRWKHFAHPDWITLPAQPAITGTFTAAFHPLPSEPTTDRWMCLDARSVLDGQAGPWLSETSEGAACAGVEVGVIPVPPPVPVEIPTPEIFTNVTQADGRISIEYQLTDCPRGVQQRTSVVRDGRKTITLTCRR
jgi:hypothetical protein